MTLFQVFDIAGSGMAAQSVRLNTIASNLANADNVAGSPDEVYRARHPVFASVLEEAAGEGAVAPRLLGIVEQGGEPDRRYDPGNPVADAEGYVYRARVDPITEMVDMISASRSFQHNVEVLGTVKQLMLATLRLGQ